MLFCGVSENFGFGQSQHKLPTLDPTWWFDGDLPGMDDATVEATIGGALGTWPKVCGIIWSKAATKASATLLIITTRIDGPSNILADCTLPFPGFKQLLMRLDMEKYTAAFTPERGYIGLPHVVAHEGGHAQGIFHLPDDSTPDLMNAHYRDDIWEPQPDDAAIAKQLYGPPRVVTPKPKPTSKSVLVTLEQDGKKWQGEVFRA